MKLRIAILEDEALIADHLELCLIDLGYEVVATFGDAEEAIRAAASVGDDMIQKRTRGYVVPESFTHGSAKERVNAFTKGFNSGDVKQCSFN